MAASYSDKQFLAGETTFQNRVRQSMMAACVSIKNEAATAAFHRDRETFAVVVMNTPDTYKVLFAQMVANDASVIADATTGGTVVLTNANVGTSAVLVTDAHMDAAVSAGFNSFFRTPSN